MSVRYEALPRPQCLGIRRRGLWDVMRFRWRHYNATSTKRSQGRIVRRVSLNKRQTNLFLTMQAQRRDLVSAQWAGGMGGQEESAHCTPSLPAPRSRASRPPELWGHKYLISATQTMVFCYSSRSWLGHTRHASGFKTWHKLWFFCKFCHVHWGH